MVEENNAKKARVIELPSNDRIAALEKELVSVRSQLGETQSQLRKRNAELVCTLAGTLIAEWPELLESFKSDPFAVVTVRGDSPENRPEVVGRTDV